MQVVEIESLALPELEDYVRLTDVALRKRTEPKRGLYIAESHTVLERALHAGHTPRSVLVSHHWLPKVEALLAGVDVRVFVGDEATLETLTGFHLHRGALAAMQRPELPAPEALLAGARRVVVIDGVVDHTNVGAMFRSVAGLGADAVFVTDASADPLYRRSVRVSMGTVLQVPWTRIPSVREAKATFVDAGFRLAALALDSRAVELAAYAAGAPERVALVFGSEGHGLSRSALAACDDLVTIPMGHGVDSLNVAATSAVVLWAMQHAGSGQP